MQSDSRFSPEKLQIAREIVEAAPSTKPWPLQELRELLIFTRVKKAELARAAGVCRPTVGRVLAGKNCNARTWMAIQHALEEARRQQLRSILAAHG